MSKFVEDHIAGLAWSSERTDLEKGLVVGNIRGFAARLASAIAEMKKTRNLPGMEGGDYDRAIDDIRAMLSN